MRVAVITGSAQGIGRQTAELFAANGYALALIDLQPSTQTIAALPAGTAAFDFTGDISNEASIAEFATQLIQRFGRVDVLVNNGGVSQRSSVLDTDIDTHRRILDVNYTGAVALTKSEGKIFRNVCCSILHIRRYSDYANVALILRFILNNSTLHKLLEIQRKSPAEVTRLLDHAPLVRLPWVLIKAGNTTLQWARMFDRNNCRGQ